MSTSELKVAARWTPDCQGKWDYDGRIVTVSTRYWPRGGGFHILPAGGTDFISSETLHPEIRPSATSSIHLLHGEPDDDGYNEDYTKLVSADFEADTEAEVKAQVEAWAQARFAEIAELLAQHFGKAAPEQGEGGRK